MKLRKYISLVLFAVYLFAAGGAAAASLLCHCSPEYAAVEPHACCHYCDHANDRPGARADLETPCCDDRHSTEITLYTGSSSENDRIVKCTVLSLPPAMAAECPCPAHVPSLREEPAEYPAPQVAGTCVLPSGLRAPPVLA